MTSLSSLRTMTWPTPRSRVKRRALEFWFENAFLRRFDHRILPFNGAATLIWGRLLGEGERQGRTPPDRDCQVAAVAIQHGMTVVTRNVRDFSCLDLPTLNPWLG
jgi:predicted nucleic acid-binding protein